MHLNNYLRESGVNYRLVDKKDLCHWYELSIPLDIYGIDKYLCRDQHTWKEAITNDIGRLIKDNFHLIQTSTAIGTFIGSILASSIKAYQGKLNLWSKVSFLVGGGLLTWYSNNAFGYLSDKIIAYKNDYIHSLIDPAQ